MTQLYMTVLGGSSHLAKLLQLDLEFFRMPDKSPPGQPGLEKGPGNILLPKKKERKRT
jgi:hypothetical protein